MQPLHDGTCFLLLIGRKVNLLSTQGLALCFCWHISLMWLWDYALLNFHLTFETVKLFPGTQNILYLWLKLFPWVFFLFRDIICHWIHVPQYGLKISRKLGLYLNDNEMWKQGILKCPRVFEFLTSYHFKLKIEL